MAAFSASPPPSWAQGSSARPSAGSHRGRRPVEATPAPKARQSEQGPSTAAPAPEIAVTSDRRDIEEDIEDTTKKKKKVKPKVKQNAVTASEPVEQDEGTPDIEAEEARQDGAEIKVHILEELVLDEAIVLATQTSWVTFCTDLGKPEAAGEAIYAAIYEGLSSLQHLFTTPRAVQAMKFVTGLSTFVSAMGNPAQLKALVESLGFGHLNLDVTIPRVVVLRDSLLDMFEVEMGDKFSKKAKEGWKALLNYVGGAIVFVKTHYSDRLAVLAESWKRVNDSSSKAKEMVQHSSNDGSGNAGEDASDMGNSWSDGSGESEGRQKNPASLAQGVPTTYRDMFVINSQVMGLSNDRWMDEILDCWDRIVTHVSNSARLQDECGVLVLRISNCTEDVTAINLAEYKSCMLASLRSLLPKDWSTAHEVAWSWLWDVVERLLHRYLDRPKIWEEELMRLLESLDENQGYEMRREIYNRFFAAAPDGQDYFKQSDTRLHFIATKVFDFTLELYREPVQLVDDISALGLRHVGYAIPTELFGPFVTACIEVLGGLSDDQVAVEAYRWSLALITNMLVRTITEGSTIVMKAINCNSTKMVKKAISCAPRGERATWFLKIQVGTQSISPLEWAIDSGNLDVADAIFEDLLTIRADRKQYYYGVDELFERHPDIIQRLCVDAPTLLQTVLDGLIWRSRVTKDGKRRVNYYVKHLMTSLDGSVSPTLRWMVQAGDQRIVSHPAIVLVSDTMWSRLVRSEFTFKKVWFMVSLAVFMLAQAVFPRLPSNTEQWNQIVVCSLRVYLYVFTLGRLLVTHTMDFVHHYMERKVMWAAGIPIPRYLRDGYSFGTLILMCLFACLLSTEPMVRCIDDPDFPTAFCSKGLGIMQTYSIFAMCTMVVHWGLLVDLAVYNTGLSAFVLVCSQVMSELGRILIALVFLLLTFGTAVSILDHDYQEMSDITSAVVALFAITVMLYEDDYRTILHQPFLLALVFLFVTASAVLLLNLLITQLSCSYVKIYADSVGYARLKRAEVIAHVAEICAWSKWEAFVKSLKLDEPIEFNEGDEGLAGGVQVLEPSSLHPVTADRVLRFGGACSPEMQWPESSMAQEDDDNKYDRLEKSLQTALKKLTKTILAKRNARGADVPKNGANSRASDGSCDDVDEEEGISHAAMMAEQKGRPMDVSSSLGSALAAAGQAAVGDGINTSKFEELSLAPDMMSSVQAAWRSFVSSAPSKEAAGELIYNALFEGAPSLQSLFTTPRAVQAMRFMSSLNSLVSLLEQPGQLKSNVEAIAFAHLNWEVTVPRVTIFRDALLDLFEVELGERFTSEAKTGWKALLNYVGGAMIYVKANYAERLRILEESWGKVNCKSLAEQPVNEVTDDAASVAEDPQRSDSVKEKKPVNKARKKGSSEDAYAEEVVVKEQKPAGQKSMAQAIPTTYKEMFSFNAAIMGLGQSAWMNEVLDSFDAMVTNFANSARLQQECDLLVLKISKADDSQYVNLTEYKSCMLAALRQLLPKEWSTAHEVAWSWLWENVERLLRTTLGSPQAWEDALDVMWSSFDENMLYEIRQDIYERFFAVAPLGQDFFKQSDSRLHYIAQQALNMTLDMYREPTRMADELSALGLRHVGYAIPTELFGPFVTACIEVMDGVCKDKVAVEAFRWSLALISNLLVRTITEGSTIVMKAINTNSVKQLQRAISCAPRGQRAQWMLIVQVGTQSISPLEWSIESGSLDSAKAIIMDLLTIRADREKYYFGVDELWDRHPDIMQRICKDAPTLLPTLLEGLIWRSRDIKNGFRRVNYFIKYLVQTKDGEVSEALDNLVELGNPTIMNHPAVVMVSDTVWMGLARRQFVNSQIWFILSLGVLLLSQAILPKLYLDDKPYMRTLTFVGRMNFFCFTTGRLVLTIGKASVNNYRDGDTFPVLGGWVWMPEYLGNSNNQGFFALMILGFCMMTHEPMFWCGGDPDWPNWNCPSGEAVSYRYSVFTFMAMAIHWTMFANFAVFNTQLSAFVLVIAQVMQEMGRFMIALVFLLLTFGSAIAVLEHNYPDMQNLTDTMVSLFAITVRLYEHDYRNLDSDPALLCIVFLFVTITVILLLNLLVAQLNTSYEYVNKDSVGFARLSRATVIVDTLETCMEAKWRSFLKSLNFDVPLEFNEGDVGLSGGIADTESAALHPVTVDSITRFGGSCSVDQPWPEEQLNTDEDDEDRFDRLRSFIQRTITHVAGATSQSKRSEGALAAVGPGLGRQSMMVRQGSPGDDMFDGSELESEDLASIEDF